MAEKNYDFAGYVTRNDVRCSDGVIIRHNAFAGNDKGRVPLVWNHFATQDNTNVLGYVDLVNKEDGVYGYGHFNDTDKAKASKKQIIHGDIVAMSIGARDIKRVNGNVVGGDIYEVALVLKGANPKARIEEVLAHSSDESEHIVAYPMELIHAADYEDSLVHSDDDSETSEEETVFDKLTDEQFEKLLNYASQLVPEGTERGKVMTVLSDEDFAAIVELAEGIVAGTADIEEVPDDEVDNTSDTEETTDANTSEESNEEIDNTPDGDSIEQSGIQNERGETNMWKDTYKDNGRKITKEHAALCQDILEDVRKGRMGLRDSMLQHGATVSIDNLLHGFSKNEDVLEHSISTIDELVTVETYNKAPKNIGPDKMSVVDKILSRITTSPMHTVMVRFADLTTDEARARGWIKGKTKIEQVYGTLHRETHPGLIYAKQSIKSTELIDIDWDIVTYMKSVMTTMWRYELARAIVIGDGRLVTDDSKIKEENIRPIVSDDDFYTVKKYGITAGTFVEEVILALSNDYAGSGTPDCIIDRSLLANVRLLKKNDGGYLWGDRPIGEKDLADLLGINEFLKPDFVNHKNMALLVDLSDYEYASPNKGRSNSYEDFDIDTNTKKWLLEGYGAGAMVMPKGAIYLTTASKPQSDAGA